jgi:hypothetical protein
LGGTAVCYLVFRCVLQFVALRRRSEDFKELEIVVLRHKLEYYADRRVDRN